MTLAELQTKANAKLLDLWNGLAIRQEAYRLKNDKYFQLVATAPVVDGADTVLQINHPTDEQYQTDVQLNYASPVPFQLQVDEWGNASEVGFKMTCIVELPDGRRFTRSRSLTDTRTRTRDIVSGSIETNDVVFGDWYLVGADPVLVTTAWEEIIEQV